MGCSNDINEKKPKEDSIDEAMEKDIYDPIYRKDSKTTATRRINKICDDKEVLNWQIKMQNDLIHRIKSGNNKEIEEKLKTEDNPYLNKDTKITLKENTNENKKNIIKIIKKIIKIIKIMRIINMIIIKFFHQGQQRKMIKIKKLI